MGRIFLTGDTHGSHDIRKLNNKKFPQHNMLTKNDYLIVCGDFGLVWNNSTEEIYWRNWLTERNFTTLFVDGNHENFDLIEQFPTEEWNGGKIHKISDSIFHLTRGQVFTIHGKTFFTMGGAASIDRANRREFISWWKQEIPSYEEYEEGFRNLEKHYNSVDYIVTHTAPQAVIEQKMRYFKEYDFSLNNYLSEICSKVNFKHWYFGHMHDDMTWGKFTMTYNKIHEIK